MADGKPNSRPPAHLGPFCPDRDFTRAFLSWIRGLWWHGGHRIRTQCPRSALSGQDGGPPDPHPYLLAREPRMLAADRAFQPPARTAAPAGPARRARMRPVFPLRPIRPAAGPPPVHGCGNLNTRVCTLWQPYKQDRGVRGQCCWCERGQPEARPAAIQGAPGRPDLPTAARGYDVFRHVQDGLLVPAWAPARTRGVADRTSEPARRLGREPPHGPVVTLGTWHH
jgi:hypothetical protein